MRSRTAFRILVYPFLCYFIIVYGHAKIADPGTFNIPNFGIFSEDNLDHMEDLAYPVPAPKPKSVNPSTKTKDKTINLLEKQQLLHDLATTCKLLEAQYEIDALNSKCFNDFAYYERPLNQKLFHNARIYSAHIEETVKMIKNHESILTVNIELIFSEFIRKCGLACLPLAPIIYNPLPEIPEAEVNQLTRDFFDGIDEILQSSLQQSQDNIISSQQRQSSLASERSNSESKSVHKQALTQLNEHLDYFKQEKIISSDIKIPSFS